MLAVEIHQGTVDSSDLSFDLELTATLPRPDSRLALSFGGGGARLQWPALAGAYHLEQATNLAPPVIWTPFTNPPASDGYWNIFALTNTGSFPQRSWCPPGIRRRSST